MLGVVSSYVTEQIAVEDEGDDEVTGRTVPANAGLVVVYDIKHAVDAIDAFLT